VVDLQIIPKLKILALVGRVAATVSYCERLTPALLTKHMNLRSGPCCRNRWQRNMRAGIAARLGLLVTARHHHLTRRHQHDRMIFPVLDSQPVLLALLPSRRRVHHGKVRTPDNAGRRASVRGT